MDLINDQRISFELEVSKDQCD